MEALIIITIAALCLLAFFIGIIVGVLLNNMPDEWDYNQKNWKHFNHKNQPQ